MAGPNSAWGIEIGANAIKAIQLERDGDTVSVSDFAVIPHRKVLTTPDLDQDDMVRISLGQFISQKSLENEHLVMSVPGHAAFARFAKLPPVEPKKVPDIVKFEAVQQIPFPIEDVEWDYETFTSDDSPEIEVGIFAITRERVQQRLGLYGELGVSPEALTLSPVAVHNAMTYDQPGGQGPVLYLDIGTQATDVVIVEDGRCWIRTFPLGGTHFTEAIASAFKLSYSKAEKLKHEAASSKYAKQIMQAMRPVFSDLLQDLQRSIGYYASLHRDKELATMVGLGSTFKIPGLRKFLGQQLQINVVRLDEYKKISVTGREAASFAEHAVNMATAYGLALQGVGLASIDANLVPVKALREQVWRSKTKWFAAAAVIAVAGSLMTLYGPMSANSKLDPNGEPGIVRDVLSRGKQYKDQFMQLQSTANVGATATNMMNLVEDREIWPHLVNDATSALASTDPQPELLGGNVVQIASIDPGERRLVSMQRLYGDYIAPEGNDAPRRIAVTIDVELSHDDPVAFVNSTVSQWLRDNAQRDGMPYRIVESSISANPQQMQTLKTDDSGKTSGDASPRRQPPRGGGGGGATGGDNQPGSGGAIGGGGRRGGASAGGGGRRGAPGSGVQPSGGGGSAVGGGGRRAGGGGRRGAPGSGVQPSGGSRSGGIAPTPSPPRGGGNPPGYPPRNPGSSGGTDHKDLNALAPIPGAPVVYPGGATYYRLPVTFEIEILDEPAASAPNANANAGSAAGKESTLS